jgi:hypothetical protein
MRIVLVQVDDDPDRPSVRTAFRRPGGELADELAAAGHEVRELSLFLGGERYSHGRSGLRASGAEAASIGLARALEAGEHDVLHVVGERAGRVVERVVGRRPWIWSYDEGDAESLDVGEVWCPRGASLVLVPTAAVGDAIARGGVPRSRIRVLPERLSTSVVRGPLDGVRVRASSLLTVMDARGGTGDVIRALSRLPGTSLEILSAGDDDAARSRLRLLARQLHVEERVRWHPLGDRVDAMRAVVAADVLVHVPHERLDLGPVVAAMSMMTAVVVTDLPDADGLVVNGCTGLRVPPAEPHQLALRLSILSADPQMRDEISLAARRFARDELAASVTTASLLETYDVVTGLRRSA